jgi:hypothetical protein
MTNKNQMSDGSESNSSFAHLTVIPKESIKLVNSTSIEDKTLEGKSTEDNFPDETDDKYLKNVVENYNTGNFGALLQNIVEDETHLRKFERASGASIQQHQQQKREDIANKVFSAIHLLDILLTFIFYLDNRRHKNDIQHKKNIFVEGKSGNNERVASVDSEKTFLASQQKTSLEHYKDYLFASPHNYEEPGLDFFFTHNNAFHQPSLVKQQKASMRRIKNIKNSHFQPSNNNNLQNKNDRKHREKRSSSNIHNYNETNAVSLKTSNVFSLNKNHLFTSNSGVNGIEHALDITSLSKNPTKSKSNTASTRLDNPSNNIISSTEADEALSERKKYLAGLNTTWDVSDSSTKAKILFSIDNEKHFLNRTEFADNKRTQNRMVNSLDFENQTMTNVSLEDEGIASRFFDYPPKHFSNSTSFNQTNENYILANFATNGTSGPPSNITATKLFNNSSLNSKPVSELTATTLQPPIFLPPTSNIKMKNLFIPSFAIFQPKYKYNDSLNNGKDQKQQQTNDSHYHRILDEKDTGGNFSSGNLDETLPEFSPFLTHLLTQIMHTLRNSNNNLTENSGNLAKVKITRLAEQNSEKNKENKRNNFLEFSNYFAVNKNSSNDVMWKYMQDGSSKNYEENQERNKNEFGVSGKLSKNNGLGGIIALLENIVEDIEGKI